MKIKNPSPEIKQSINSAVEWFKKSAIKGYDFVIIKDEKQYARGTDGILVPKAGSVLWARFYNMETNKPFFTGKDGIARDSVSQIENERRVGYVWYGRWPEKLIDEEYPKWLKENGN